MPSSDAPTKRQRIEETVDDSNKLFMEALTVRLTKLDPSMTNRQRVETLADSMLDLANYSCEVEERVSLLSIIIQELQTSWDYIAAPELARPRHDKYMDKLGRLSLVMTQHQDAYMCLQRVAACIAIGRRVIDRLDLLHRTASRAAGLLAES